MSEEQTTQNMWPVLRYPTDLEIIENLSPLADPVKQVEEAAAAFFNEEGKSLIDDMSDFDRAATFALDCNAVEKRIDARRKNIVEEPNAFVKQVNGLLNGYVKRITAVRARVTGAAQKFKKEHDEAARKREEEERAKRESEALERAQRLQDAGHTEAANQLIEIAATAPKTKPAATALRSGGGSAYDRARWAGEIADKKSVLKAAIEGRFSLDAITISQAELNNVARAIARETVIDGIRIKKVETLGLRR